VVTTLAVLGGDVYLYGRWTNRWGRSRQLEEAVERLALVPRNIAEWSGKDLELSDREVKQAEIAGYVSREYQNRSGASITVLLVCGRAGPTAVHTPDVCYPASGYQMAAPERKKVEWQGSEGNREEQFWATKFTKPAAVPPSRLRVYWAWTAEGTWQTPSSPRRAFAGKPALYKLYVMRAMSSSNEQLEDELCQEFLRLLLPRLERALFATGPATTGT
jgi:hypothetical protein